MKRKPEHLKWYKNKSDYETSSFKKIKNETLIMYVWEQKKNCSAKIKKNRNQRNFINFFNKKSPWSTVVVCNWYVMDISVIQLLQNKLQHFQFKKWSQHADHCTVIEKKKSAFILLWNFFKVLKVNKSNKTWIISQLLNICQSYKSF